jgi:hypothetical protein
MGFGNAGDDTDPKSHGLSARLPSVDRRCTLQMVTQWVHCARGRCVRSREGKAANHAAAENRPSHVRPIRSGSDRLLLLLGRGRGLLLRRCIAGRRDILFESTSDGWV